MASPPAISLENLEHLNEAVSITAVRPDLPFLEVRSVSGVCRRAAEGSADVVYLI
ncbi:MAG: hypothetical protein HGA68_00810 [Methanothrix sp.]|nr:hypothetical protein [Methanothrix sp.]